MTDSFPFQYIYSTDNGETWSEVQFPFFKDKAERVVRQPINSCLRDDDGTFYVAADAAFEPGSVLWRSRDNMKTWENPKEELPEDIQLCTSKRRLNSCNGWKEL